MLGRRFVCVCVTLCCLHAASEPLPHREDSQIRVRGGEGKDALAISREIFRNISKQLRENIKREGASDKSDRFSQSKIESRIGGPYTSHHHHEHHWGPYFEADDAEGATVTAHVGSEALLNCKVGMLKDKTVMWLQVTADSAQLLTVGREPYAGDNRIAVKFQYPNNWRLSVNPVRKADAGLYMCQISTHPPRGIQTNLTVLPPILTINADETHEIKDRYYKAGSSIHLACLISDEFVPTPLPTKASATSTTTTTTTTRATTEATTKISSPINRIDLMLNKSWSVETTTLASTVSLSKTSTLAPTTKATAVPTSTEATLVDNVHGLVWRKQGQDLAAGVTWKNMSMTFSVSSASQNDSGTYSCHLQNHSQATVNVHVLTAGENQAAVHHDTWNKGHMFWKAPGSIVTVSPVFILLSLQLF